MIDSRSVVILHHVDQQHLTCLCWSALWDTETLLALSKRLLQAENLRPGMPRNQYQALLL